MGDRTLVKNVELESRISNLIGQVESEPEQWYKLLIEKVVKQEVMIEKLMERMDALEKYQNFHSAVIDSKLLEKPAFLRDAVEVRAAGNLLPDEGFYNIETSSAGFDFRWTKQDFYFDLPLNRDTDKTIELQLASAIKPELLEDVRCYTDGAAISLKKVQGEKGHLYRGVLPKQKQTLRATRVSFHTKTSYSPKEINPDSADTRMLAVTFKKLIVE